VHKIYNKVVSFLITSIYINTSNFISLYIKSQPSSTTTITTSAPKSVTFINIAKTLKNLEANFYSVSAPHSSHLDRISILNSNSALFTSFKRGSTTIYGSRDDRPRREDYRLLILIEPSALL
jgi:hypothetical protein